MASPEFFRYGTLNKIDMGKLIRRYGRIWKIDMAGYGK
jgi:hypothetical protein